MVLRSATSLLGALEGVVPENLDFFGPKWRPKKSQFSGPTSSNAPRIDVALLKTITYCAIKTTGTLIVITVFFAFIISKGETGRPVSEL